MADTEQISSQNKVVELNKSPVIMLIINLYATTIGAYENAWPFDNHGRRSGLGSTVPQTPLGLYLHIRDFSKAAPDNCQGKAVLRAGQSGDELRDKRLKC
jgi:hypothetical protein